jgi:hypothetical protein
MFDEGENLSDAMSFGCAYSDGSAVHLRAQHPIFMTIRFACRAASLTLAPLFLAAACGSTSNGEVSSQVDASTEPDDASSNTDGGSLVDASSNVDGGLATRNAACTPSSQQNGTAVNTAYGRLDGTLVFVVGVDQGHACNGDSSHVHLQVEVSGDVYDVAVDIGQSDDEVGLYQGNLNVPGGTWSEGWHSSDTLSYRSSGVSSSSFPLVAPNPLGSNIESLLAGTSKISIFCTGYSQGNGCHDVHYVDGSKDGAIVLDPTSADSPVLFFRFSSQNF